MKSLCNGLALALMLVFLSDFPAATAANSSTEADLARLREQIRKLEHSKRDDVARQKELDNALEAAEREARKSREALRATRRERAALESQLTALRQQLARTEAEVADRRAALAAQIRLAHVGGGAQMRARALLMQSDAGAAGRELAWLGYLAQSRAEQIARLRSALDALERDRLVLEERTQALAAVEETQREQVASLDGARAKRALVLASASRQLRGREQQIAKARRDAAALERMLRELQRKAQRAKPEPAPLKEGLSLGRGRWPVAGRLLADYGQPRAGGQLRWDGVLIAAPAGTDVKAVRPGRVVYADWLPGLGLLLVLDHGGGWMSLYGHNQDLTRKVGERVATGDLIARVGDTGGQSRPALYFEVRRNGRPQNPRQWVR